MAYAKYFHRFANNDIPLTQITETLYRIRCHDIPKLARHALDFERTSLNQPFVAVHRLHPVYL